VVSAEDLLDAIAETLYEKLTKDAKTDPKKNCDGHLECGPKIDSPPPLNYRYNK
jgi:hypothetical protein